MGREAGRAARVPQGEHRAGEQERARRLEVAHNTRRTVLVTTGRLTALTLFTHGVHLSDERMMAQAVGPALSEPG